jgi:hypothetical protein
VTGQSDEALERREWELLYQWGTFSGWVVQSPSFVRRFADWPWVHPIDSEIRSEATTWWTEHEPGLRPHELEFLACWRQFSEEEFSIRVARAEPETVRRFADWLARRGGRTPIEALDMPLLAVHTLRVHDVRYIEQLDEKTLAAPPFARVRFDVLEGLRRWRHDRPKV